MNPFRRRPLRLRIALVAMLALLWSQTALAWHAMCAAELPPPVAHAMSMVGHDGGDCHEVAPPGNDTGLCVAHCDQDVPSPDTPRVPALPALPALVPGFASALTPREPATLRRVDSPPPIAWHRPTAHPAALLLI
ncbi:MAG: hypothetical protein IT472_11800 [Thermomonas sp.]|uniref:hypothetical protein n=1 Tax=Thermomonas sp. TaxID=1971895 RepID=UPI002603B771|nr:hypothetical protein [Thermomonas sp.]MCC7097845.1 hypothetical protein [Thermomonas sp.]